MKICKLAMLNHLRPNLNHEIRLRAQNTEGNRMFQQHEDSSSQPFDNDIQLPNLNASKGNMGNSTPYK